MARKELHHDGHTVSLLSDHTVITRKYRGKILVGDVAFAVEGIIRTTCKEMKIEIIDKAPGCYHGLVGHGWEVVEKYIGTKIMRERTNRNAQALYLSAGYSDWRG